MSELKKCIRAEKDIHEAIKAKTEDLEALIQRREALLEKSPGELLEEAKKERDEAVRKYASGLFDEKRLDAALEVFNKAVFREQTTNEVISALDDTICGIRSDIETLTKRYQRAKNYTWLELSSNLIAKIKSDVTFQTLVHEAYLAGSLGRGFHLKPEDFCNDLFTPRNADLRELEKGMRRKYLS